MDLLDSPVLPFRPSSHLARETADSASPLTNSSSMHVPWPTSQPGSIKSCSSKNSRDPLLEPTENCSSPKFPLHTIPPPLPPKPKLNNTD